MGYESIAHEDFTKLPIFTRNDSGALIKYLKPAWSASREALRG